MRVLYDLAGAKEDQRFSPFCFRVKMALRLIALAYDTEVVRITEKEKIAFSQQTLLPVLRDGDLVISDSWKILRHLDAQYPETPQLMPQAKAALHSFVRQWCDRSLHAAIFRVAVPFIHATLAETDQAYFRETREKRLGQTLEAVAADRAKHLAALQLCVDPLRATLNEHVFLEGEGPGLADLLVQSAFLWAMAVLPFPLFEETDPLAQWLERVRQEMPA